MKTERICGAVMILAAMFAVATGARAGEMTKSCTLSPKLPNPGPVDFALEPLVTGVFTCDIVTPSGYEFLGAGPPDITGEGFVWTQTGEWEFKVTNTKWESAHTRVSLTARWKLKSEEGEGGGGSGPGIISRTGVGDAYALEGELIVNADPAVVAVGAEATVSARASDSEYTPALSDWTVDPSPPAGFVGSWAGVSSVKVQQYVPGEAEVTAFYCQNPEKNAAANVTFVAVTSIEADPDVVCIGDDVSYTVTTQPAGHEAMVSYTPADTGTPGIKEVVAVCGSSSATCTVTVIKVEFTVVSDDPGDEELTDNRKATATITVTGIEDPSGLSFAFSATPVESSTINKMGTAISFTPTANPLVWETSKTYWYGVLPDHCCYFYHHAYKFDLTINGECTVSKEYQVGWPDEDPAMSGTVSSPSTTVIHESEPVPGIPNWYRCQIVFGDFVKDTSITGIPTTCQYAEENAKEEAYHEKQWLGQVDVNHGGQGDCFTAKGIKWWIGWIGEGPWYTYGSTPEEAYARAIEKVNDGEPKEWDKSVEINTADRGFVELKAKEYAGYNAAFKYHCTYESIYGPNPVNHHHPAY